LCRNGQTPAYSVTYDFSAEFKESSVTENTCKISFVGLSMKYLNTNFQVSIYENLVAVTLAKLTKLW